MSVERRPGALARSLSALVIALGSLASLPAAQAAAAAPVAQNAAAAHPTRAFWLDIKGAPAAVSAKGAKAAIQPLRFRSATLDRASLASVTANVPAERAGRSSQVIISLPDPDGGFQRFAITDVQVMEPGLAAKHPEIRTYAGKGIDDPSASARLSLTPLGFQASIRSAKGAWYIDPYYERDDSLYVSYYRRHMPNPHAGFAEATLPDAMLTVSRVNYRAGDSVQVRGSGFVPGALVAITVRNAKTDVLPRQTLHATAGRDGSVNLSLTADPYKNLGSYAITASDGKTSATTTYEVVADTASPNASTGPVLRTYRLALLSDPGYANYHGAANVTAAKVALINRVSQVYEYDTSIRLVLIANNDLLNLNTAAQFSQPNGPCGGTACFPSASVSCVSSTITRNRQVIGLLVGASSFDIGHIGVGAGGGGVASLGVVGLGNKAQGCTGLPTPVGDLFAVDYVAHEMGHQFAGNHTFNGTLGSCSGSNRSAANSVEPGSGSSIMAYAGICANDNLQPHSDPYWSFRSFEEITAHTSAAESNLNEVQMSGLIGYAAAGGQLFQLRYNGNDSVTIGTGGGQPYTTTGVKAAIEGIAGWPSGGTVTVSSLNDTTFTVTFGGTLAGTNVSELQLVNCTGGCSGFIGEITKGGISSRQGNVITSTGNTPPVVSVPAATYTIPVQTPFSLTGSATDIDGDTITYMWEQTDRAGSTGTSLISNTKTNGPLFRQFGTRAVVSATDTLLYDSPGENKVTTNPTRVFPDLPQILANNTNAETGVCPAASATPTATEIDCFSEFLPTPAYVGFSGVNSSPLALNFRLTARDGKGGVNNATVQLQLATGAGPFLVTAPNTAVTLNASQATTVTWNVANTSAAPVSAANVKISLSTDSGLTYPYVLAASTANDGSESVMLPAVATTKARIKVEAVGNVFFDVSNADFTIKLPGDLNNDGQVDCTDIAIVQASMGKSVGQPGFDPRADVDNNGVVNIRDLTYVVQKVTVGIRCSQ